MALRATILTEVHVGKIGSASPIRELRGGYNVFFIVIPTDHKIMTRGRSGMIGTVLES